MLHDVAVAVLDSVRAQAPPGAALERMAAAAAEQGAEPSEVVPGAFHGGEPLLIQAWR